MHVLEKIAQITKPYWPRVILGIILGLMVSGIIGAIVWLIKPGVDVIFIEQRYEYFTFIPVSIVILFSVKGLLHFGQMYLMRSASLKLLRDTQNRLHKHILYIPVEYFHQEASGIVISRVINDVRVLSAVFSEVIRPVIVEIPTIVVLLGVASYQKWDLTVLSIIAVPLIAYSTKKFGKKVKKRSFEAQRKLSFLTHRLSESITGAKIIKVFNREAYRDTRFTQENQRVYRENVRVIRLKEYTKLFADLLTGCAIALVFWYGGRQVINGTITAGALASILVAIYMVFAPVKKLGNAYTFLQEIRAAIERIEKVLNTKVEDTGTIKIQEVREGIRFQNVSFAYSPDTPPVLGNITLDIRAGEVVAVVGPSGSGKTTFADLIPRFFKPTEGTIRIDGIDINDIDLKSLRNLIGIVSQDIILFNDTVRENIAFGNEEASLEDIKKAAEMAYAHEFIEKTPDGYDTIIGERGLKFSGGQRQRIAIARAILKNPPLLILDEATSALDSVSETIVQKALEGVMKDRTTIVIAHRLSTIINADRIVIFDKGKIIDTGIHEELMSRNETYMKLYNTFVEL